MTTRKYACLSNDGTVMEVKRLTESSISLRITNRGAGFEIALHNQDAKQLRKQLKKLLKDI